MPKNLASYFANGNSVIGESAQDSKSPYTDDEMGPSISMAVQADDDEEFQKSTFNLKRTRSMGLLDEYVDPTKKLLGKEASYDEALAIPANYDDENNNDNDYNFENDKEHAHKDEYLNDDSSGSNSPPDPDTDNYLIPHDDHDLVYEPQRHVDYLSHKWDESEISKSWKYIILKKKKKDQDLVNAARLENASWRTWAKARNNLKTVSPEVVNWSKDSDVTWLYGPIVRESGKTVPENESECGYGSDDETSKRLAPKKKKKGPKPILKKRSVSEIIEENSLWRLNVARQHRRQLANTSSVTDSYGSTYPHDDYDAIAAKVNAQYYTNPSGAPNQDQELEYKSSPTPMDIDSPQVILSPTPKLEEEHQKPVLASILTSFSQKGLPVKDRHIHFNDRVEQCMAVNSNLEDDDNHEEDSIDGEDYLDDYRNNSDRTLYSQSDDENNKLYMDSDSNSENSSSEEEEGGIFISARYSRKNEGIHTPTDLSSESSFPGRRDQVAPSIKLLPCTTLNYGSDDDESGDNSEYYSGNAVSHNVNTFRGYDYMYDYNSVYTADTSSFLGVNNCDIVDVPEDIALQTPIETDTPDFVFNQDPKDAPHENSELHSQKQQTNFTFDSDGDGYNSDNEPQFIENSQDNGSDDDNEVSSLCLKRTQSLGKASTSSVHDLQQPSPVIPQTHSFITGKPLNSNHETQEILTQPQQQGYLKRTPSSKSFIFDSDSGSGSDSDSNSDSGPDSCPFENENQLQHDDSRYDDEILTCSSPSTAKTPFTIPTQGTSVVPVPKNARISSGSPFSESPLARVSSGNTQASLSDIAISGYISPRNDSMQSVVSKQKIVGASNSPHQEVDQMNKHLENCHIGPSQEEQGNTNDESIQQMMFSAREMASKYLHSWKK